MVQKFGERMVLKPVVNNETYLPYQLVIAGFSEPSTVGH